MSTPASLLLDTPLDLEATLYSGQAFRWQRRPDATHRGFIDDVPLDLWINGRRLHWTATGHLAPAAVRHYFRLDKSHDEFIRSLPPDPSLMAALALFPGLRLLRQDPWEMLVSFVVSQNSNEAKIRRTIETLCRLAGQGVTHGGVRLHRFPTPTALAGLDEATLRSTGMGYRAPYIRATALAATTGGLDPWSLPSTPYEAAFDRLLKIPGIGAKVADCILLYGCDHRQAFPTDVWVKRFLKETYFRRRRAPNYPQTRAFAWKHFGPQAGYAQHYLFHYRRAVGALATKPA